MEQTLTPAVFQLDGAAVVKQLSAFIDAMRIELYRDGTLANSLRALDKSLHLKAADSRQRL